MTIKTFKQMICETDISKAKEEGVGLAKEHMIQARYHHHTYFDHSKQKHGGVLRAADKLGYARRHLQENGYHVVNSNHESDVNEDSHTHLAKAFPKYVHHVILHRNGEGQGAIVSFRGD